MDDTLLPDVEAFLADHDMPETKFGKLALNDKHFVRQLRDGRECFRRTARKVRAFMATYGADTEKADAA